MPDDFAAPLSAPGERSRFTADLLAWFSRTAADLPWRRSRDAYRVWLSEILLQQTQVATVIPYFERFTAAYPDIYALAAAPLDDVLKLWEGLGYYARARNLHRAAREVVGKHDGQFPETAEGLIGLPGIGRYTANAIASIAFGERVPVLDGNVIRVLSRLYNIADDVTTTETQRRLWALVEQLIMSVPPERSGDFNQAMMELGREVCKPRKPRCGGCPASNYCVAFASGTQAERPTKPQKAALPHFDIAAGVIYDEAGRILIVQRPLDGLLGGLWEFPSDRCRPSESLTACLERALVEKLAMRVEIGALLLRVRHTFTHFRISLHAFDCRCTGSSAPIPRAYTDSRWVAPDKLGQFAFPRADRKVIEYLHANGRRLF